MPMTTACKLLTSTSVRYVINTLDRLYSKTTTNLIKFNSCINIGSCIIMLWKTVRSRKKGRTKPNRNTSLSRHLFVSPVSSLILNIAFSFTVYLPRLDWWGKWSGLHSICRLGNPWLMNHNDCAERWRSPELFALLGFEQQSKPRHALRLKGKDVSRFAD